MGSGVRVVAGVRVGAGVRVVAGIRVGAELRVGTGVRVGAGHPNFLLNERRGEYKIEKWIYQLTGQWGRCVLLLCTDSVGESCLSRLSTSEDHIIDRMGTIPDQVTPKTLKWEVCLLSLALGTNELGNRLAGSESV